MPQLSLSFSRKASPISRGIRRPPLGRVRFPNTEGAASSLPCHHSFELERRSAGHSTNQTRKASLRAVATFSTASSPGPTLPRAIISSRARKVEEMHVLAYELGFFCQPSDLFLQDLATRMAGHLKNRVGKMVYQTVGFSMENFPVDLARQVFAMATQQPSTSRGTTTWTAETMAQLVLVFGSIFEGYHNKCVGMSKALQTPTGGGGGADRPGKAGGRARRPACPRAVRACAR